MRRLMQSLTSQASRKFREWTGQVPPVVQPTLSEALHAAKREEQARANASAEIADMKVLVRKLGDALEDARETETKHRADYLERSHELVEARQMQGGGPWLVAEARGKVNDLNVTGRELREASNPLLSQGAYGDMELALQNINWRREINLSWLEFSRWGIQQIMLISRLYYIKNPIIRRLIDIAAQYVFARGVEVSSPDPDANEVLQQFFKKNKASLGQIALTNHERSKYTDGNLFFAFFSDTENTGEVSCRTIDPTEVQDIICDPNDADRPWYYRRSWTQRTVDLANGSIGTASADIWYPALGFNPESRPESIGAVKIKWDTPVYHRKCGTVAKWHFGCPLIYPALDWAREARRFLEACASVMQALSQIALKITTKGGQQALEGVKLQMQTTVGPASPLWDQNPPAVAGGTFASGPGTTLEAMKTDGAAQDPNRVREYKRMCCMTVGVPESFLSAMDTGNLATATSLDRPTELVFLERQEAWREDLVTIASYVLEVSARAAAGDLREALIDRAINPDGVVFCEAERKQLDNGRWIYIEEAAGKKKINTKRKPSIEVKCTFPAIREGDIPQLITACAEAMTLGNKGGQVIGIDEKAGVKMLFEYLGFENGAELVEEMYPEDSYDPERSQEDVPPPVKKLQPNPGGQPQDTPGQIGTQQEEQGDLHQEQQPNIEPLAPPPGKTLVKAHHRSLPAKVKEAIAFLRGAIISKKEEISIQGELSALSDGELEMLGVIEGWAQNVDAASDRTAQTKIAKEKVSGRSSTRKSNKKRK